MEFYNRDKLINYLNKLVIEKNYVYRGYSSEEEVLPGLIRNKLVDKEISLLQEYENIVCNF